MDAEARRPGAMTRPTLPRNGIDHNVPAGTTTWNLRCSEVQPDIQYRDVQVTALALTD
jgi:hypothetical protein